MHVIADAQHLTCLRSSDSTLCNSSAPRLHLHFVKAFSHRTMQQQQMCEYAYCSHSWLCSHSFTECTWNFKKWNHLDTIWGIVWVYVCVCVCYVSLSSSLRKSHEVECPLCHDLSVPPCPLLQPDEKERSRLCVISISSSSSSSSTSSSSSSSSSSPLSDLFLCLTFWAWFLSLCCRTGFCIGRRDE